MELIWTVSVSLILHSFLWQLTAQNTAHIAVIYLLLSETVHSRQSPNAELLIEIPGTNTPHNWLEALKSADFDQWISTLSRNVDRLENSIHRDVFA